ncbi:MAG: DUF1553 domain-containing protein, partial [Planctomycetes bacterium]|nr:DUF1553 domain-containing protein [Planctomycetota bacterium]
PDGAALAVAPGEDPRRACAAALIADPRCAQALANRAWRWLVGRPLAAPLDAWAAPAEPALLAVLADDLRAHGLDPRRLWRVILRSRAYQAAASDDGAGDPLAATTYRLHLLDAEALLDAINAATGSGERYVSQIPEPFTVLPWDQRAVALADGSISLPFLELFGRPARASGLDDERTVPPSDLQAQHLLNANHIQGKLQGRWADALLKLGDKAIDELWLRCLSRLPGDGERAAAAAHLAEHPGAGGFADLAWALLNTVEFRCAH